MPLPFVYSPERKPWADVMDRIIAVQAAGRFPLGEAMSPMYIADFAGKAADRGLTAEQWADEIDLRELEMDAENTFDPFADTEAEE